MRVANVQAIAPLQHPLLIRSIDVDLNMDLWMGLSNGPSGCLNRNLKMLMGEYDRIGVCGHFG